MTYLVDPQAIQMVCPSKVCDLCRIKPLYGIDPEKV